MDLLLVLLGIILLFQATTTYRKGRFQDLEPLRIWENDPLPGETKPVRFTSEGELLLGGDMIPSRTQLLKYRTARTIPKLYWPNAIVPFAFNATAERDRKVIELALNEWQKQTCLKFNEVAEQAPFPHIVFKKLDGCNSYVGMDTAQQGQKISIGVGCNRFGIVVHETGHAIGLHHEQSRPDRERHLQLRLQNTDKIYHNDFNIKFGVEHYPEPYDYDSIMHYPGTAFTNNGKNTIVTLDPFKQVDIGQRDFLSFYDIKAVNTMYNCSDHCVPRPNCMNEGYTNKACQCTCPPYYEGNTCEIKQKEARKCGGIYRKPSTIRLPRFSWEDKDNFAKCVWWFKAPKYHHIEVTFKSFKISSRGESACKLGSFEIRKKLKYDGKIYCGTMLQGKRIVSKGNQMILLYRDKPEAHHRVKAHVQFKKDKKHHRKPRHR